MLEMALITMGAGINSIAPLGFSGDSYYLFGELKNPNTKDWYRESEVSFRNYCGMLEMMITDSKGKTLIYTKIDGLPVKELISEYYRQFLMVRDLILKAKITTFDANKLAEDYELSQGFKILNTYLKAEVQDE